VTEQQPRPGHLSGSGTFADAPTPPGVPADRVPVVIESHRRIWVVWSEYGTGPEGYFTTPDLAEAFVQTLREQDRQDYRIEEDEVWDRVPQRQTFHARHGQILAFGWACDRAPAATAATFWDTAPPPEVNAQVNGHGTTLVDIWHRDPAEAQRIYDEQIAALLAARATEAS
jgi:hypothetical protein